jgi:replicative DNA helicase
MPSDNQEALVKRIRPHDEEAEQALICAMLMDNEVIVTASELITGSDFYNTQYGTIFDTIVELSNGGHPVDVITLQNSLRAKNVPPEVSSDEFLKSLIMALSTSAHADSYARIIADKSTLRKLIRVNEEIADECYASKNHA